MDAPAQAAHRPRVLGFNHINLVVSDLERAVQFYRTGLGMEIEQTTPEITFLTTPGRGDSVALQLHGGPLDQLSGRPRHPGDSGGVDHLGFDVAAGTVDAILKSSVGAGGRLLFQTPGADGSPVTFISDPDGYVIQLTAR
jgi:catechol 2,3-dioxygenase-like lactoylglutathione lyase family enzyme